MEICAVIFDLGGVLLRTEDRQPRAAFASRLGLTYAELDDFVFNGPTALQAAVGAIPEEQHWEALCTGLNLPLETLPDFQTAFWGGDRLDQNLVELIRSLRPRYRTALLSNAWSNLRLWLNRYWPVLDVFDEVVISAEVGLAKPDPRIYQLVVDRLGVASAEAVFLDDFLQNVEAARKAGLHAIQFMSSEQARADLEKLLQRNER
jgi:HAD superfamily hydrolase (TIGR01509 family)